MPASSRDGWCRRGCGGYSPLLQAGAGIPNQDPGGVLQLQDVGSGAAGLLDGRNTSTSSCNVLSYIGSKLLFTLTFLGAIFSANRKFSLTNVFSKEKTTFMLQQAFCRNCLPSLHQRLGGGFRSHSCARRLPSARRIPNRTPQRSAIPPHPEISEPAVPNHNQLHLRSCPRIKIAPRSQ